MAEVKSKALPSGMYSVVQAHSILNSVSGADEGFGLGYTMNMYRGCTHQCIYCDSRSDCYRIEDFGHIEAKLNGPDVLRRELASKRRRATVGTGSMHDPYMPIESELQLTRSALQILAEFRFPVHVITKSPLVTRDTDLLKDLSRSYAAVSFSFSTVDDRLAAITEPGAPPPAARLEAMRELNSAGIYTGVCLMPVLPWLGDDHLSIEQALEAFQAHGASYVIPSFGLTMRRGQRGWFLKKIKERFPELEKRYRAFYGDESWCACPAARELEELAREFCRRTGMEYGMRCFGGLQTEQGQLFG